MNADRALRTRPLKGRMMSFYLDYYPGYRDKETMKVNPS